MIKWIFTSLTMLPLALFLALAINLIPLESQTPTRQTASEISVESLQGSDAPILNYWAKRALSYYPYFTREQIIQDIELLLAINQGIDRGVGSFFYHSHEYYLPDLWSPSEDQKSFVKKGKLYDRSTGAELSWSKETFLKYLKKEKIDSISAKIIFQSYSQNRKKFILNAITNDEAAYEFSDEVYTLSGVKIENTNSILASATMLTKFRISKNAIKLASANMKKFISSPDGDIIELKTGKKVSEQLLKNNFSTFTKKLITPMDYFNFPPLELQKISLAILNNQRLTTSIKDWRDYKLRANNRDLYRYEDRKNYCPIKIILANHSESNEVVTEFLETLENEKIKLMRYLKLNNDEYNELALLAYGILGAESSFGENRKYVIKEKITIGNWNISQSLIKLLKNVKGREDVNSRGLTQIKDATALFLNSPYDQVAESDLNQPRIAAIATMIVLEEKYRYLKRQKSKHPNIDEDNWMDYLDYYYTGSAKEILRGTATPAFNKRLKLFNAWQRDLYLMEKCL